MPAAPVIKELDKVGYAQLELNQVAFRRDGRIEAQCPLSEEIEYIENGMVLVVDPFERVIKMPVEGGPMPTEQDAPVNNGPLALHYSAEHMYDNRANALKDFVLEANSFLPRLGYLSTGDKYTTNAVCHTEDNDGTLFSKMVNGTRYYAHPYYNGYHFLDTNKEGAFAMAIRATTMPDGQKAIMFQAL